jgi:alpha,alpha-trehalase
MAPGTIQCKTRLNYNKFQFFLLFLTAFVASSYCWQQSANAYSPVQVDVLKNIRRLIDEEDTDGDRKITVDDHFIKGRRGDKKFWLLDQNDQRYEIVGTYYLSNLLQELRLCQQDGQKFTILDPAKIFENPVGRISRCIRQLYWDGLTRRIDEENIVTLFADSKTASVDGFRYIYVPHEDDIAHRYFSKVSDSHPELKIKVVRLPDVVTPEWVNSRHGRHGLLSLALQRGSVGNWQGVPFVVPGGRFNEMYGWDSFFEALGLLQDKRVNLAKAMVDNFVYEINHYGKILNANRSYYLTRSQPPFLTSMALAVYEHLPHSPENKQWLKKVIAAAIKEYRYVWMGEKHLTDTGLSRYCGQGIGTPPEVEPGHFDAVFERFAKKHNMAPDKFERIYRQGRINAPDLDEYFIHDRAMRESGHDTTYRWDDRCADFVTVDLNCLLYKIELDIAKTIKNEFGGSFKLEDGTVEKSAAWFNLAEKRKQLINKYLWDSYHGLFLDYDLVNKTRKHYVTPVVFYPLWSGLATKQQAKSILDNALPGLEMPGGLAGSTRMARGEISETRPDRQWDYPYGWAPHQMLAWQGLIDYGFDNVAQRLIYRWLYTITVNAANYNGTIPEKFNVVTRSHSVFAEYGNVGTKFDYITMEGFGWMNASYQSGLSLLHPELRTKLEMLIPPEWIFEK